MSEKRWMIFFHAVFAIALTLLAYGFSLAPVAPVAEMPSASDVTLSCYMQGPPEAPWKWSVAYDEYRQRPIEQIPVFNVAITVGENGDTVVVAYDLEDGGMYACDLYIIRGAGGILRVEEPAEVGSEL